MSNGMIAHSAGGVVQNVRGEVLLIRHGNNAWSFPKGHIEPNEDELVAARREISEEAGITDLAFIQPLGSFSRYRLDANGKEDHKEFKVVHIYHFSTAEMFTQPKDSDILEGRWVPVAEVADLLAHRADKEFYISIQQKLL